MKSNLILLLIILVSKIAFSQTTIEVTPKGIYSEINVSKQNKMIELLFDTTTRSAAVDTIFEHINQYNPPVLYVFSQALFLGGEQQSGIDWYLFAQINALYDANRCADNSAKQATTILESQFRPVLEKFIKKNKKDYLAGVDRTIELFKIIPQDYDIRWINLHGMGAISTSLGNDKETNKELTVPNEKWAEIKESTIEMFEQIHKK